MSVKEDVLPAKGESWTSPLPKDLVIALNEHREKLNAKVKDEPEPVEAEGKKKKGGRPPILSAALAQSDTIRRAELRYHAYSLIIRHHGRKALTR